METEAVSDRTMSEAAAAAAAAAAGTVESPVQRQELPDQLAGLSQLQVDRRGRQGLLQVQRHARHQPRHPGQGQPLPGTHRRNKVSEVVWVGVVLGRVSKY